MVSAILRIVGLVWIATVTVVIGLIYLAMWAIYGRDEVLRTFDGYGVVGYVGLAVILGPGVMILLASVWVDWRSGRWLASKAR